MACWKMRDWVRWCSYWNPHFNCGFPEGRPQLVGSTWAPSWLASSWAYGVSALVPFSATLKWPVFWTSRKAPTIRWMIHHFPPFSLLNILPEKEDVTNKKSVKQHLKKNKPRTSKSISRDPCSTTKPVTEVIRCNYALFPDKPWDWCSSQTGPIHPPLFLRAPAKPELTPNFCSLGPKENRKNHVPSGNLT